MKVSEMLNMIDSIQKPRYFELKELVCPEVYNFYKNIAWQFFDTKLLITLDVLREHFNRPIYVNNWDSGGLFDERGFRCIKCPIVQDRIMANEMYVSPHMTGQGVDFDVEGMEAEEARQWIIHNPNILPYPVRLEAGVSWVHLDTRYTGKEKVWLFNP
jgi:hypothetical protein